MKRFKDFFEDPKTGLPYDVRIGIDFLPYEINRRRGYGKRFNVFVVDGRKCFHRSWCRYLKPGHTRLLHRYEAVKRRLIPCRLCRPVNVIDYWYDEYLAHLEE